MTSVTIITMSQSKTDIAVIKVGASQHLVSPGQRLSVSRIKKEPGETFTEVSLLDGQPVTLKVIAAKLSDKIRGLKFRSKSNYLRRYGARQKQTVLEVVGIGESGVAKAKAKAADKPSQSAGAKVKTKTQTKTKTKTKEAKNG